MNRRTFTSRSFKGLAALALAPQMHGISPSELFDLNELQNLPYLTLSSDTEFENMLVKSFRELGTRSLRFLAPHGCEANIAPLKAKFEKLTGAEVVLELVSVDDIAAAIVNRTLAGDQNFDIALPATFAIPDLVELQAIQPIGKFAARYEPKNFRQDLLYSLGDTYRREFYGYQTDGDCYVMFYSKDLLESPEHQTRFSDLHGYALDIPKTWSELDTMIRYFHEAPGEQAGGSLFRNPDYVAWEWWLRFHANGELPLSDSLTPLIDTEAGVLALESMINVSQYLDPRTKADGLFQNWSSFSEGRSFCNIGWGGTQKYLNGPQSRVAGKLRYGPTPGGKVSGKFFPVSHFNWGWNYVIGAESKSAEAAYLFTLFAVSPSNSAVAVSQPEGFFDPFRASHYQDQNILRLYTEEFLTVHRESLRGAIPDFYVHNRGKFWTILTRAINYALQGRLPAKEALSAVSREWQKIIRSSNQKALQEQWRSLKLSYPESFLSVLASR